MSRAVYVGAAAVVMLALVFLTGCGGGETACEKSEFRPTKACNKETRENEAIINGETPGEQEAHELEEVGEGFRNAEEEEQKEREESPSGESKWEELAH